MSRVQKCWRCGRFMRYVRKEVVLAGKYRFADVEAWVCKCGEEVYPPDEVRRMEEGWMRGTDADRRRA